MIYGWAHQAGNEGELSEEISEEIIEFEGKPTVNQEFIDLINNEIYDVEKLINIPVSSVLIGQTLCENPDIEEKFKELFD